PGWRAAAGIAVWCAPASPYPEPGHHGGNAVVLPGGSTGGIPGGGSPVRGPVWRLQRVADDYARHVAARAVRLSGVWRPGGPAAGAGLFADRRRAGGLCRID